MATNAARINTISDLCAACKLAQDSFDTMSQVTRAMTALGMLNGKPVTQEDLQGNLAELTPDDVALAVGAWAKLGKALTPEEMAMFYRMALIR